MNLRNAPPTLKTTPHFRSNFFIVDFRAYKLPGHPIVPARKMNRARAIRDLRSESGVVGGSSRTNYKVTEYGRDMENGFYTLKTNFSTLLPIFYNLDCW